MSIKVIRKVQPIQEIRVTRGNGFKDVVLTRTKSGKASVKVAKEGQQGILFADSEAKELCEAISTLLAN